jgi:UDP-N-acetylglucosamine diphosphorylase / glucose-1-phosphate thymidylyltransferase / UDP-N-acetylgalactosamine diphosphorylase / glucosamine-1-phosphate N-acetyltransferase / galactosamine-1-phosphate N-acetyltransferase
MRICVYEDRHVRGLEPLTLTRPAVDLLCGLTTLLEKQVRYFAATAVGHLCRPVVADLIRTRDPVSNVNDPTWLRGAPTILVNARWVPPPRPQPSPPTLPRRHMAVRSSNPFADAPYLGTANGAIAFAVLDQRSLEAVSQATIDDCLQDWSQSLPTREVGGTVVGRPWELIDLNPSQIARDFEATCDPTDAGFHPTGFAVVGPADRLLIDPSAKVDPMVVADTTHGPVLIGPHAVVHAFTRLEGPCVIGAGTVLHGAQIRAGTTFGPQCRIGGEVECSIVLGYTNKYHEGFLGHSYVGEWVNLAAGTHTSDLRCDYRPVSVPVDGSEIPTGRTKVGAIIGDHVKTGLGVLLNCGTAIGPFAQVLPTGGFAPRDIPAFTRVAPASMKELSDVDRLLTVADTAMQRRGKMLTPVLDAVYRAAATRRRDSGGGGVLPLRRTG